MDRASEKLAAVPQVAQSVTEARFAVRGVVRSMEEGKTDRASARDLHPPRPRGDRHHGKTTNADRPLAVGQQGAGYDHCGTAWCRPRPAGSASQPSHVHHPDAERGGYAVQSHRQRRVLGADAILAGWTCNWP